MLIHNFQYLTERLAKTRKSKMHQIKSNQQYNKGVIEQTVRNKRCEYII